MSKRKLSKNQVLMSYIDMLCKKGCCCPHHLPKQDGSWWWLSAWSPGWICCTRSWNTAFSFLLQASSTTAISRAQLQSQSARAPRVGMPLPGTEMRSTQFFITDSGKMKIISSSHYPSREGISCNWHGAALPEMHSAARWMGQPKQTGICCDRMRLWQNHPIYLSLPAPEENSSLSLRHICLLLKDTGFLVQLLEPYAKAWLLNKSKKAALLTD